MTSTADSDVLEAERLAMASVLRSSGLRGDYLTARSPLGERVYALARAGRGSYLWGPPGTGKTYAAAHAVREFAESSGLGRSARLVTAKRLLDEIRDGYSTGDDMLSRACSIPLLALDDLGAERPTEWAVETITSLLDARTSDGLPTIVTSNLRLGEIRRQWGEVPGARVASRIAGACLVIEVPGEDRRLGCSRETS